MYKRLHRVNNISFKFDGVTVAASEGDTVAGALLCHQETEDLSLSNQFRPYCQMASCYGCLVKLNGRTVQACTTLVEHGMELQSVEATDDV